MRNIPINIKLLGSNYEILAKFESIEGLSDEEKGFELLCSVKKGKMVINPEDFYANLPSYETFQIYKKVVENIRKTEDLRLYINTPYNFLFSDYSKRLIKENTNIRFGFELPEETGSILFSDISDRLREIRREVDLHVLLDDFGTQNSNFDFFLIEGLDGVKLSKELFWHLYDHNKDFLKHLLSFLKARGTVVVEGVDRIDRYKFCSKLGVLMQGYYIKADTGENLEYA